MRFTLHFKCRSGYPSPAISSNVIFIGIVAFVVAGFMNASSIPELYFNLKFVYLISRAFGARYV